MSRSFHDDPAVGAKRVIEEMSFQRKPKEKAQRSGSYVPIGPPPACPPPPPSPTPPASPINPQDEQEVGAASRIASREIPFPSYQHSGRPGLVRNVNQDYGNDDDDLKQTSSNSMFHSTGSMLRGDATVRPNTGESNSAEGEGTALHEVMYRIRVINIVVSSATVLLQSFHLLMPKSVTHLVLGGYIIFFSLILCGFELRPTPLVGEAIRDHFGLLYHPTSRVVFLILLAGLSLGQGGILQSLLALCLFGNAMYTLYVYVQYPEYRRIHADRKPDEIGFMKRFLMKSASSSRRYTWTNPDASLRVGEGESLLV